MRRQEFTCWRTNKNKAMAENEILFKELPFRPARNQVFFIENDYDSAANIYIRNNYFDLKSMFANIGMDFYYLPYLLREHDIEAKVRYYAPYLTPKLLVKQVQSNAFVPYISDDDTRKNLKPSFVFEGMQEGYRGDTRFLQVLLSDVDLNHARSVENLMRLVVDRRDEHNREIQLSQVQAVEAASPSSCVEMKESMVLDMSELRSPEAPPAFEDSSVQEITDRRSPQTSKRKKGRLSRIFKRFIIDGYKSLEATDTEEESSEAQSLVETAKILRDLRLAVQKLRLEGVTLMAIHDFIDKQEPLSRMVITPDYRIFLPDYNNMEIEMGALPKAIYFLYLRYPEGIIYKHMQDYFKELLNIYKQLRPNTDEARLNLTITKVVNPLGNALNENIARIRKAFVEKFDEHLANNYIITGERGSQYSIPLDRDLIIWEE